MDIDDLRLIDRDLAALKGLGGSTAKAEMAKRWVLPHHKEFLDLVGNDKRQWFVTWDKVLEADGEDEGLTLDEILYAAEKRLATPSQTAAHLKAMLDGCPEAPLRAIVNKTLDAGITVASVKKATGARRKFQPALASDWLKMSVDKRNKMLSEHRYASTPKMDGLRCVIKVHTHDQGAYSRSLKPLKNLDAHVKALAKMIPKEFPCHIDGEILSADNSWNSTVTGAKRSGAQVKMLFYIFDAVLASEAESMNYQMTSEERWEFVREHVDFGEEDMFCEVVRTPVRTVEEVEEEHALAVGEGWEGVVLHDLDAPYACKRSTAWIKVKSFFSEEFEVVDFVAGRGKHLGRLGAIVIQGDGIKSEVGTGFSDHEREHIWANPEEYRGRMAEIKFFEKTEGSLRFPVFLRMRDAE